MVVMGLRRPRELMNTQSGTRSTGYRIGAVAKLTGISPDALRVWERRYAVVKTGGTSSGCQTVCIANCNSSCNRELEQTAAMLFPHVAV